MDISIKTLEVGFIFVIFDRCGAIPSNVTCKSSAEIDEFFNLGYYTTFYSDNIISSNDFHNPINKVRKTTVNKAEISKPKKVFFGLETIEYTTDEGWLLEDKHTQISAAVSSFNVDPGTVSPMGGEFGMILHLTGKKVSYERVYMKFQDLLAEVSGLLGFIMAIIFLLFTPYTTHKYYENIANQIFTLQHYSFAPKASRMKLE